jgi:NADH-quinone oxidoreductase subunit A
MNLLPVILFVVFGFALGIGLLSVSIILGKKPKEQRVHDVYESGVNPVGSATRRYDVKFYLTAILFLLFDVEIVFLFPWALTYQASTMKTLLIAEFVFFMFIFLVGYLFVLFSKSLDWEE